MINLLLRSFQISSILICLGLTSGNFSPVIADDAREEDHKILKQLFVGVTKAFNDHDIKTLSRYFAKNHVFIGIDQTVITSPQQLQTHFDHLLNSPNALLVDLKTEPTYTIPTTFLDENTGFSYGTTIETYKLKNGEEVKIKSLWTTTLVKEAGQWKVATLHLGTNVLDNPILNKAIASSKKMAIFSFIGGLILGIFVIKFTRSKA